MGILGACMFGEIVTNRFDMFYDAFCNTNWYIFPIELQRILVIFMPIVQKSVLVNGSGKIICRLEEFKKVRYRDLRSIKLNYLKFFLFIWLTLKFFSSLDL